MVELLRLVSVQVAILVSHGRCTWITTVPLVVSTVTVRLLWWVVGLLIVIGLAIVILWALLIRVVVVRATGVPVATTSVALVVEITAVMIGILFRVGG